jgi:hypothetical protein
MGRVDDGGATQCAEVMWIIVCRVTARELDTGIRIMHQKVKNTSDEGSHHRRIWEKSEIGLDEVPERGRRRPVHDENSPGQD